MSFFVDISEAKMNLQAKVVPKVEMGGWRPVKKERVTFSDRKSDKMHKEKEPYTEKPPNTIGTPVLFVRPALGIVLVKKGNRTVK
ncbi:unnamed protein product [Lupinus luteus]|uniref:Uncharacterized protein n=1 Tax=Lupinus luteus TaxID=3873 RepID=A0AAV1X9G4_LUPLU